MNSAKTYRSIKNGRDYRTGLTESEQKRFDSDYRKAIDNAQKNGNKLRQNEKAKIFDGILEKIKNENISVDAIKENVKNEIKQERTLKTEIARLEKIPESQRTFEQKSRLAAATEQLAKIETNTQKDSLLKKVKDKVKSFVNEEKLPNEHKAEKREGYNNYIDPDRFVEGLWDQAPNTSKDNVEKSQLESVEKLSDDDIIKEPKAVTLDGLTKDVLKTKPPFSPRPQRWLKKGGEIEIDADGNWIYTNSDGISVKYVDDYPDFKSAGLVNQEADIGEFVNREVDKRKAKKSV